MAMLQKSFLLLTMLSLSFLLTACFSATSESTDQSIPTNTNAEENTVTPNDSSVSDTTADTNDVIVEDTPVRRVEATTASDVIVNFPTLDEWELFTSERPHEYLSDLGFEYIIHEQDAMDPTWVGVRIVERSQQEIVASAEEYMPYADNTPTVEEEGVIAHVRSGFSTNECASHLFVHEITAELSGLIYLAATCPTHSEGYDAAKIALIEGIGFSIK